MADFAGFMTQKKTSAQKQTGGLAPADSIIDFGGGLRGADRLEEVVHLGL